MREAAMPPWANGTDVSRVRSIRPLLPSPDERAAAAPSPIALTWATRSWLTMLRNQEEKRSMNESTVDENHPAYVKFLECFIAGASLQDIYGESKEGFGVRERRSAEDPEARRRLQAQCRIQFNRIFGHEKNLAEPIDKMIGL